MSKGQKCLPLQSSGYNKTEKHVVETGAATFYAVAVDIQHKEKAIAAAKELVEQDGIQMIELCGGLANAEIVAQVKKAVNDSVPIGAVYYGPESRRPLVDLLKL